jgi:Fur family ferric uptake transcriptional regulator
MPLPSIAESPRVSTRNTNQRKAIRDVFIEADRPLSTEEVLKAAQRHKPGLGIATVYRTIKMLADEGWISTVRLPGERPRYELAGKPHHHHFYCQGCGRVYEVPGSEALLAELTPRGFVLESHDLVLCGRCAACNAKRV